jgi:DNA/RNA endonuclease G (NUC1)
VPAGEIVLSKRQFVAGYNPARGGADWVSWNINSTHFAGVPRCDCFSADQTLPSGVYRVVDFDYRNSGYDRGHMVQSESRTTTDQENASTFLLTNIIPQAGENNQGPWSKFENYLNDLARQQGKEIYVVAGGEYAANAPSLKNEGKVLIPSFTWKVAVIMAGGKGLADVDDVNDLQVIAIRMPNLTTADVPGSAVGIRNNPHRLRPPVRPAQPDRDPARGQGPRAGGRHRRAVQRLRGLGGHAGRERQQRPRRRRADLHLGLR